MISSSYGWNNSSPKNYKIVHHLNIIRRTYFTGLMSFYRISEGGPLTSAVYKLWLAVYFLFFEVRKNKYLRSIYRFWRLVLYFSPYINSKIFVSLKLYLMWLYTYIYLCMYIINLQTYWTFISLICNNVFTDTFNNQAS